MGKTRLLSVIGVLLLSVGVTWESAHAQSAPSSEQSVQHGLFGLLDSRSQYGTDLFPEPLLAEEGDLEREFRTTWFHAEGSGHSQDLVNTEVEWSFGQMTVEAEGGYEKDVDYDVESGLSHKTVDEGAQSMEFNARYPVYQYVSSDGFFDDTVVAGLSYALDVHTPVSDQTELEPQAWNLLRLGERWTLQTRVAYSMLIGAGDDAGLRSLEYATTLGYTLPLDGLHIAALREVTPLVEFDGDAPLNKGQQSDESLIGAVGLQLGFESIGFASPKLSVGYAFPIDSGARKEFQWGIVSSIIVDF